MVLSAISALIGLNAGLYFSVKDRSTKLLKSTAILISGRVADNLSTYFTLENKPLFIERESNEILKFFIHNYGQQLGQVVQTVGIEIPILAGTMLGMYYLRKKRDFKLGDLGYKIFGYGHGVGGYFNAAVNILSSVL